MRLARRPDGLREDYRRVKNLAALPLSTDSSPRLFTLQLRHTHVAHRFLFGCKANQSGSERLAIEVTARPGGRLDVNWILTPGFPSCAFAVSDADNVREVIGNGTSIRYHCGFIERLPPKKYATETVIQTSEWPTGRRCGPFVVFKQGTWLM
jgi:hypothetical protein